MDFNPNAMPPCLAHGEFQLHVRHNHTFQHFMVRA